MLGLSTSCCERLAWGWGGGAARGLAVLGPRESASLLARALRAFQIVLSKDPQGQNPPPIPPHAKAMQDPAGNRTPGFLASMATTVWVNCVQALQLAG